MQPSSGQSSPPCQAPWPSFAGTTCPVVQTAADTEAAAGRQAGRHTGCKLVGDMLQARTQHVWCVCRSYAVVFNTDTHRQHRPGLVVLPAAWSVQLPAHHLLCVFPSTQQLTTTRQLLLDVLLPTSYEQQQQRHQEASNYLKLCLQPHPLDTCIHHLAHAWPLYSCGRQPGCMLGRVQGTAPSVM